MEAVKDASSLYEVERQAEHAARPGETYSVKPRRPHLVTNGGDVSATFLVLQGIGEYDFVPLLERDAR